MTLEPSRPDGGPVDSPADGSGGPVWTVVVAGGSGDRFGGAKQYVVVEGRRVLDWSVGAALSVSDGVVVVVPADDVGEIEVPGADHVVAGGASRSDSVRAGLAAVPADAGIVLVHDAARPAASTALFARVVSAVRGGAIGVVPGVPVTDTVRSRVDGALDRSDLLAVQTPQGFAAAALRQAHAEGGDATDDATLVERAGGTIVVVDGETTNTKVTHPDDLDRLRPALGARIQAGRVGLGFDVHPFADDPDRPLVLGGVRFPGPGLAGHSDADVIAHACTDAVLGAAGLGDIGSHFPDDDPAFAGADSIELLTRAAASVRRHGFRIVNVDCTVQCDRPRIAPARAEMEQRLGSAVDAPVTVKGKRSEGLGFVGRSEGMACWAVAMVAPAPELVGGAVTGGVA